MILGRKARAGTNQRQETGELATNLFERSKSLDHSFSPTPLYSGFPRLPCEQSTFHYQRLRASSAASQRLFSLQKQVAFHIRPEFMKHIAPHIRGNGDPELVCGVASTVCAVRLPDARNKRCPHCAAEPGVC